MLKNIFFIIIIPIIVVAFSYFFGAFITLEKDVLKWSTNARLLLVLSFVVSFVGTIGVLYEYHRKHNDD